MGTPIMKEIVKKINKLPSNLQLQVLIFVDALQVSSIRGISGKLLLQFAETISTDDLALMQHAIDADFEQVDSNEW